MGWKPMLGGRSELPEAYHGSRPPHAQHLICELSGRGITRPDAKTNNSNGIGNLIQQEKAVSARLTRNLYLSPAVTKPTQSEQSERHHREQAGAAASASEFRCVPRVGSTGRVA